MERDKISPLLAALKLDDRPLVNQFMYVEEHDTADGSFILSSLMKNFLEKKCNIILILCHNTEGHFQALSRKLGYSLMCYKESGQVYTVNVLDKIINQKFYSIENAFKEMYDEIKAQVKVWGDDKDVCIMVENLGNLIFVNAEEVFVFVMYLRTIALERQNSSLILSLHNFENCSSFEKLTKFLRHTANVKVTLKGLQSGRANDVTGHLIVTLKENKCRQNVSDYQYQLTDKNINVFAPGSRLLS